MVWTTYGFFPSSVLRCVSKDARRLSGACRIKESQQEQSRIKGWIRSKRLTVLIIRQNTGDHSIRETGELGYLEHHIKCYPDSSQIYKQQNLIEWFAFVLLSCLKLPCVCKFLKCFCARWSFTSPAVRLLSSNILHVDRLCLQLNFLN